MKVPQRSILFTALVILIGISCKNDRNKNVKKEFYENGSLRKEIIYFDDKDTNTFSAYGYYPTGKLKYITTYKDGKRDGEYLFFNENGGLKNDFHFLDGKFQGVQRIYNDNNEVSKESYFLNGKLIMEKEFRKNIKYKMLQALVYKVEDSVKNRIGVLTYDSVGHVIEDGSFFYTVTGPDTIDQKQKGDYIIKFFNKRDDFNLELMIGTLTPELTLQDTSYHFLTQGDTIKYTYMPADTGYDLITGLLELKSDSVLLQFPFFKEIYVLKK